MGAKEGFLQFQRELPISRDPKERVGDYKEIYEDFFTRHSAADFDIPLKMYKEKVDRSYGDTFCGAGRSFDELFRDLQAKPIGHRLEIDACEDFEPWPVTEPWLKDWLAKLPQ